MLAALPPKSLLLLKIIDHGHKYHLQGDATHRKAAKKISIETFLRKYRKGGPGVKYEFNQGIIEKTGAKKLSAQYIADNLFEKFEQTPAAKRRERLVQELEVWTSGEQFRKPDLCDLCTDKKWFFEKWSLNVYPDVEDVTGNAVMLPQLILV